MPDSKVIKAPSFSEALAFWSKLGWISFGGTAGYIAIMHDYLVVRKKWISNAKFLHALSHCMLLPGPEAQQLAIYIGWQFHGTSRHVRLLELWQPKGSRPFRAE
jgi:chromate transporter